MEREHQGKDLVASSPQGHRVPARSSHRRTLSRCQHTATHPITISSSRSKLVSPGTVPRVCRSAPIMPPPPVPSLHPPSPAEVPRRPQGYCHVVRQLQVGGDGR